MLSKLSKFGVTLILSMALLLCTSFLAFAAPLTDSNVSVIPTKQVVLTTPIGNKFQWVVLLLRKD